MKYLLPIILSLFSIYHSHAQSAEDKFGAWYMLDGTHKIADAWSIKTGFQLRSFEVLDNINLLFYYTGANYHINKNLTLTLMYSYLDIDRSFTISGESHLYENRPYEQLSYTQHTKTLPIYHRLRFEQRFLNYQHDHTVLHRVRYRLGTKIKLSKAVFFNINNEIFMNFKDEVFTENRFYAAFGFNVSKSSHVQLGYLNHEINHSNLNRLQVGLFFKTDLRKKKV